MIQRMMISLSVLKLNPKSILEILIKLRTNPKLMVKHGRRPICEAVSLILTIISILELSMNVNIAMKNVEIR